MESISMKLNLLDVLVSELWIDLAGALKYGKHMVEILSAWMLWAVDSRCKNG